ncbi:MAG: exonuclease SbcCD subunit D C-terminal domain-containing protein [Saprospiraceae bacterium]
MLRILHTADWHLGQTLLGQPRQAEQQRALDWVLETVEANLVEALIVAGDIFDVASPAEDARKMYNDCLAKLAKSCVKWVVIIAGNHDSPRMISNVKELAGAFNISIVAIPAAAEDCKDDLIEFRDPKTDELRGVVAAVPFLQDRYVRSSSRDQTLEDKERALTAGIHAHFERLAEACNDYPKDVPVLATGHLFASGAVAREGQDNIYVGNIKNLNATQLPSRFDYVALGHIHRPQKLPGAEHVTYSGSLIALDFQESSDEKGVWLLDLEAGKAPDPKWIPSTVVRRLKQFSGTCDEITEKVKAFGARHTDDEFTPWAEAVLVDDFADEKRRNELRQESVDAGVKLLKITRQRTATESTHQEPEDFETLDELSVEEVFARKCADEGIPTDVQTRLDRLFHAVVHDARTGKIEAS